MKYPYISCYPIIVEAFSDVRTMVKTLSFTEQDAYIWAIDAARQIGGYNYDSDSAYLHINRNQSSIPRDFYLLENLWLCNRNTNVKASEPVSPRLLKPEYWIKSSIMRPADSATLRLCKTNGVTYSSDGAVQSYTLKVPPGTLRTSFLTGVVCMDYLKIPMDKDGIIMIQDEANGILCIKNFILMMLLKEGYLMGQVNHTVFETIKTEFEDYLRLAQQQQKGPDPSTTAFKTAEQDARFRVFGRNNQ